MAGENTRASILEGATELLRLRGYRGTNFDDIARHLGLSRSAVAWHFRTKAELLAALVTPLLTDIDNTVRDAEAQTASPAQRQDLLKNLVTVYLRHRRIMEWLLLDVSAYDDAGTLVGPAGDLDGRIRVVLAPTNDLDGSLRASAALGAISRPLLNFRDTDLEPHQDRIVASAYATIT